MREGRIRPSLGRVSVPSVGRRPYAAMREGRIRPSLGRCVAKWPCDRRCRNEGGANSPLVGRRGGSGRARGLGRNEGGANSPLVAG